MLRTEKQLGIISGFVLDAVNAADLASDSR